MVVRLAARNAGGATKFLAPQRPLCYYNEQILHAYYCVSLLSYQVHQELVRLHPPGPSVMFSRLYFRISESRRQKKKRISFQTQAPIDLAYSNSREEISPKFYSIFQIVTVLYNSSSWLWVKYDRSATLEATATLHSNCLLLSLESANSIT